MTIKTQINGLPFQLEVPMGMDVEFSEGMITVKQHYSFGLNNPGITYSWNQQPAVLSPFISHQGNVHVTRPNIYETAPK